MCLARFAVTILGACAWTAGAPAADIYTWTDAQGVVHYSNERPEDAKVKVYKGDAAQRPAAAKRAAGADDQHILLERIDKLEADLDKERDARFAMLERQLDMQREETRRLGQERERLIDLYGPSRDDFWAPTSVGPGVIYLVPTHRPHPGKGGHKMRKAEPSPGYPSLSAMPSFRPSEKK